MSLDDEVWKQNQKCKYKRQQKLMKQEGANLRIKEEMKNAETKKVQTKETGRNMRHTRNTGDTAGETEH